jgi:hypothetical protein
MKSARVVAERWPNPANSSTEWSNYDLLNLCFQTLGDFLIGNWARATRLCGASLRLKVSGDVQLVTVAQKSLQGVSVDIPAKWLARFDLTELSRAACLPSIFCHLSSLICHSSLGSRFSLFGD